MTVMVSGTLTVESFATTALLADGEKPSPSYSGGMIMPKKRSFLRNSQTLSGRSRPW